MYSCKDIHKIVLSEESLSPLGKIKFKFHMFICKSCKVAVTQMSNLKTSISSALKKSSLPSDELANELKNELKEKYKKNTES